MTEAESSALIVISKNWLLPTKLKPGRTPSKDAPLTKRKAQNREAQRAFRERRAAKVLELETNVNELKNLVNKLQEEHFQKIQYMTLENEQLKQKNEQLQKEIVYFKKEYEKIFNSTHFDRHHQPNSSMTNDNLSNVTFNKKINIEMGDCPIKIIGQTVPLRKKPTNSQKNENSFKNVLLSNENLGNMDFVQYSEYKNFCNDSDCIKYQKKIEINDQDQVITDVSFSTPFTSRNDPIFGENDCGFCIGNPDICLCLQTQNNSKIRNVTEIDKSNILPPILMENNNDHEKTEEKSLKDIKKTSEKLEILEPSDYVVQNEYEPGSCPQCKADSLSMLFCKTLASKVNNQTSSNCCSNDEKKINYYNTIPNSNLDSNNNFLPCSAVYKTLSQH
ncbi:hypothetical protein PCK1_001885 [Pneumocystis canis]|nr:hypothetical protein PCK1_001885 [Pneumocystis canis]